MLKATEIDWCVDEETDHGPLPEEVPIPEDVQEDGIADYLSDTYGFLVNGFRLVHADAPEPSRPCVDPNLLGSLMDQVEDFTEAHGLAFPHAGDDTAEDVSADRHVFLSGPAYDELAGRFAGVLEAYAKAHDGLTVPVFRDGKGKPCEPDIRELRVQTPAGEIRAKVMPDDRYPGILVSNVSPGEGEPAVLVEYSDYADEQRKSCMQALVWPASAPEDDVSAVFQMSSDLRTRDQHTLYCLVGKSGSGKSALAKKWAADKGLTLLRSKTTRPIRPGETPETADHVFVDQAAADRERDQMAAYTKVCGFEYYATLDQIMQSDIYLIDPAGLIRLKRILDDRKLPVRLVVILLEVTEEIRRQRLLIRDGKLDEDRLRWDTEEFDRDLKPVLRTFPDLITLWNTRPLTETLDRLYERLEERRRAGLRFEHEPVAEAW